MVARLLTRPQTVLAIMPVQAMSILSYASDLWPTQVLKSCGWRPGCKKWYLEQHTYKEFLKVIDNFLTEYGLYLVLPLPPPIVPRMARIWSSFSLTRKTFSKGASVGNGSSKIFQIANLQIETSCVKVALEMESGWIAEWVMFQELWDGKMSWTGAELLNLTVELLISYSTTLTRDI